MTRLPDTRDDALARTSPARDDTESSIAGRLADAARAPADLGTFIGRFEVVRLLGRGGFGVVYEARDTELGRHVALKLLRTDRLGATDRESLLEMFRGEAEAAAKLNHPNVVTIHDFGTDEGVPYLVLELLSRETLARRLERGHSRRRTRSPSSRRSAAAFSTRTPRASSTAISSRETCSCATTAK